MAIVPATTLSTPRTAGALSLCKGFPIFSESINAGISAENVRFTLINVAPQLLGFKFSAVVAIEFFAGVCGPSWATDITVNGTHDGNTVDLDCISSHTTAGLVIGVGLTFECSFHLQVWGLRFVYDRWHSRVEGYWSDVGGVQISIPIDVMGLLIEYFLDKDNGDEDSPWDNAATGLSLLDDDQNGLAQDGSVEMRPELYQIINIIEFLPGMKPLIKFLDKVGGEVEVGPTVGLVLPVVLTADRVATSLSDYAVQGGNGKLTGSVVGPGTVENDQLGIRISSQSSIEIRVGFGFKLGVLKYFSVGARIDEDILSLLRIPTTSGQVPHTIIGSYGATPAPMTSGVCCQIPWQNYEVVLDELVAPLVQ